MAATCRVCGQAIDTPNPPEGPPSEHACCAEPAYRGELRELIALAKRRATHDESDADVRLEAPPSVREAIRLAEGLLPALPPAPPAAAASPEPAPAAAPPPAPPRYRPALVALPALALVAAGALVGSAHALRHATAAPALPVAELAEGLTLPVFPKPEASPPAPPPSAPAQPSPLPARVTPARATPDPAHEASLRPARPHPQAAAVPRPRHAPAPAPAPPASSAPPAPEQPSLMQAITEAVQGPRNAPRPPPHAAP